jgi:hypothetical protein
MKLIGIIPPNPNSRNKKPESDNVIRNVKLTGIDLLSVFYDDESPSIRHGDSTVTFTLGFRFNNKTIENSCANGIIAFKLRTFARFDLIKQFRKDVFFSSKLLPNDDFQYLLSDEQIVEFFETNKHHLYQYYIEKLDELNKSFEDFNNRMEFKETSRNASTLSLIGHLKDKIG